MSRTPPRPDLGAGASVEARRRPTLALGLVAGLLWVAAALWASRTIGWYAPQTALPILLAGTPVVVGLGLVATRKHTGTGLIVLGAVLLVASLVVPFVMAETLPGVAQPDQTPLPGRPTLALTAAPEGNFELWLMRGDADHVTRLTATPAREIGADLSPDGTQILFASDATGTWDLSVMTLGPGDTPGPIRAIASRRDADEVGGVWSPDGSQIAFAVDLGNDSEVWVAGADGSDAHRISTQRVASSPTWSPDGTRIAFTARRADDPSDADIWIADADGSAAEEAIDVTDGDLSPFWSPDGTTLLFSTEVGGDLETWQCALPCAEPENLTADPSADDWAAGWPPDGHALVASDRLHAGGVFVYFVDDAGALRLSLII